MIKCTTLHVIVVHGKILSFFHGPLAAPYSMTL